MEGVGGWSYPGCSHEDVLLSVQVGGSMCVYRPAIAAISIKHRVTMPQSPLYLDIYVSTRSSSRQASDKERCGQGRRASCPVASVPITMQTIAQHRTPPLPPSPLWSGTSFYLPDSHCGDQRPRHRSLTHIYISTISAHPHARSQPRVVAQIRILDTWLWKVNNNVHFLFLSSRNLIFHIHVEVLCETQVSRAGQNTLSLYFTHFADNIVLTFKIEHLQTSTTNHPHSAVLGQQLCWALKYTSNFDSP